MRRIVLDVRRQRRSLLSATALLTLTVALGVPLAFTLAPSVPETRAPAASVDLPPPGSQAPGPQAVGSGTLDGRAPSPSLGIVVDQQAVPPSGMAETVTPAPITSTQDLVSVRPVGTSDQDVPLGSSDPGARSSPSLPRPSSEENRRGGLIATQPSPVLAPTSEPAALAPVQPSLPKLSPSQSQAAEPLLPPSTVTVGPAGPASVRANAEPIQLPLASPTASQPQMVEPPLPPAQSSPADRAAGIAASVPVSPAQSGLRPAPAPLTTPQTPATVTPVDRATGSAPAEIGQTRPAEPVFQPQADSMPAPASQLDSATAPVPAEPAQLPPAPTARQPQAAPPPAMPAPMTSVDRSTGAPVERLAPSLQMSPPPTSQATPTPAPAAASREATPVVPGPAPRSPPASSPLPAGGQATAEDATANQPPESSAASIPSPAATAQPVTSRTGEPDARRERGSTPDEVSRDGASSTGSRPVEPFVPQLARDAEPSRAASPLPERSTTVEQRAAERARLSASRTEARARAARAATARSEARARALARREQTESEDREQGVRQEGAVERATEARSAARAEGRTRAGARRGRAAPAVEEREDAAPTAEAGRTRRARQVQVAQPRPTARGRRESRQVETGEVEATGSVAPAVGRPIQLPASLRPVTQ